MSEIYKDGKFGVKYVDEITEGLTTKELACEKIRVEKERMSIKNGYERIKTKAKEIRQRIKTKAKEIRQNYRNAIGEGQRSGSRKNVCNNWDKLRKYLGRFACNITPMMSWTLSVGNTMSLQKNEMTKKFLKIF